MVTPHTGVWIETIKWCPEDVNDNDVTPHTGVWIETTNRLISQLQGSVTPHTGVWIETFCAGAWVHYENTVTPHTGVWIETAITWHRFNGVKSRHAPHGRVD